MNIRLVNFLMCAAMMAATLGRNQIRVKTMPVGKPRTVDSI